MKRDALLSQPLVSILIINHNYGHFIEAAIRSVMVQDYSDIECIVVDNGSDDDSVTLVESLIAHDARFRLISFHENRGQLGAFFAVFNEVRGEFVMILDADDRLCAGFVSSHVQVHLGLTKPVAFTSSNVIEINGEDRMLSGGYKMFGSPLPWTSTCLAELSDAPRIDSISDVDYEQLLSHVTHISHLSAGWFWSPGSANMFRRSVLRLVCPSICPAIYKRAADNYLNPLCHALGGSALIDMKLSFYRIHAANYFALHEGLSGLAVGRPEFITLHRQLAEETLAFILEECQRFYDLLGAARYWELLEQLSRDLALVPLVQLPNLQIVIAKHFAALRMTFGDHGLVNELARRFGPWGLSKILVRAHIRKHPWRMAWLALVSVARRKVSKRRQKQRLLGGSVVRHRLPLQGRDEQAHDYGPVAVISDFPPILWTGIAYDEWLGIASAFGRKFGNSPAGFFIYPTWTIEDPLRIAAIGDAFRAHLRRYPQHCLIFMGNTQKEADLLAGEGVPSVFLNKNFSVSEHSFRPLRQIKPDYDAVYNARFVPEKRHELASLLTSIAYIGYVSEVEAHREDQRVIVERLLKAGPRSAILNPLKAGLPVRVSHDQTNAFLNRARVGLCLSAAEGSNYASMEYLLAGLAVVSTPSLGGRDVYFDPEFCIICEPDPQSVKAAVDELIARNIPRDYIRSKTLARIDVERQRFQALVDTMSVRLGRARSERAMDWSGGQGNGFVPWDRFGSHLQRFEERSAKAQVGSQAAISADIVNFDLENIQLQPAELRPIVQAIRSIPKCRLLVFGCGHDSRAWEIVNQGGTTVFIEDNEEWMAVSGKQLTSSEVVKADYGTRVSDWPAMLDKGVSLLLDLPEHVLGNPWDVILVDAPAGFAPDQPGRARSIYTASRLVAKDGVVFVHDYDRPLEREFCARYLKGCQSSHSVVGRATLMGFYFSPSLV